MADIVMHGPNERWLVTWLRYSIPPTTSNDPREHFQSAGVPGGVFSVSVTTKGLQKLLDQIDRIGRVLSVVKAD